MMRIWNRRFTRAVGFVVAATVLLGYAVLRVINIWVMFALIMFGGLVLGRWLRLTRRVLGTND